MTTGPDYRWPLASGLLGALLVAMLVLLWPTWVALYGVWFESGTYSHGILVFPAVAYLIYDARNRLQAIRPSISLLGVGVLAATIALWYVARIGDVQVIEQFSAVAAITAIFASVLGLSVVRILAFPLLFLFFAVPIGDALIPHLMHFTAWFTVAAIKLSGIPVYQDALFISIPRGDFEVAKACSGIRYLIASATLGTFFAYITFVSWRRRLAFVALSLALPILANGLRAYGIIMIAHFSNMRYAVGVDHLIYGWLFFGLIMFILFWVGSKFREEKSQAAPPAASLAAGSGGSAYSGLAVAALALAILATASYAYTRAAAFEGVTLAGAALPRAVAPWRGPQVAPDVFTPDFAQHDDLVRAVYLRNEDRVGVTVHSYTGMHNELVHTRSVLVRRKRGRVVAQKSTVLKFGDESWPMMLAEVETGMGSYQVAYWYQVGARRTGSRNVAKLYEWGARVRGRQLRRAFITISSRAGTGQDAGNLPQMFLQAHAALLAGCVTQPQAAQCNAQTPGQ